MFLGDDCRSSASLSVILRFSGGRCRVRPWMSLPLDQSASVETKPSDLLPVGYTPHGQHSGSPEGEGARGISQPQTRPSLSRRFGSVWPPSLSLLSVPIASGSAFSRRAGWGHTQVWQELRGGGGLTAPGTDFQRVRGPHTRTTSSAGGTSFRLFPGFRAVAGFPLAGFAPCGLRFRLHCLCQIHSLSSVRPPFRFPGGRWRVSGGHLRSCSPSVFLGVDSGVAGEHVTLSSRRKQGVPALGSLASAGQIRPAWAVAGDLPAGPRRANGWAEPHAAHHSVRVPP